MECLKRPQIQRLERLLKDATATKTSDWNPARSDADVIYGRNSLTIQAIDAQRRRARTNSTFDDLIVINICGSRYETHRTTLEHYPETLLGNVKQRKYYYDKHRQEYFFDRHRGCFEAILYYYQSRGRLRRPDYISLDIFLEEVTFFQLGEEALKQLRKEENIEEVKKIPLPKNRLQRHIWATMEYPSYSLMAKIVNILSLVAILTSTILLAIESLPQYTHLDDLSCQQKSRTTTTSRSSTNATTDLNSTQEPYRCSKYYISPFFLIQAVCIGYFTIEFLIRIVTAPSILQFIRNLMNWIDLIAIIPFYVTLVIALSGQANNVNSNSYVSLRFLRILRLARAFKFFRVFKGVKSLRVLLATTRQSLLDFFIMIVILTLLGFLFGSAAYYAENNDNGAYFDSIPKATYWGIITITSVGYGDIAPVTPAGRLIACLCALFGAATIGMLVSVLVDRYQRVYSRKSFYNEEIIDFHQYFDDENNDNESRTASFRSRVRRSANIEDPDARAKEHAAQTPNLDIESDEHLIKPHSSRTHLTVGYAGHENQEATQDLASRTSTSVTNKQLSRENISFDMISTDNSLRNVQLESLGDHNDEVDQTEISTGCTLKVKARKLVHRSLPSMDDQLHIPELKV